MKAFEKRLRAIESKHATTEARGLKTLFPEWLMDTRGIAHNPDMPDMERALACLPSSPSKRSAATEDY